MQNQTIKNINKHPLVAIFKNITDTNAGQEISILQALYQINNGTYSHLVNPLRKFIAEGNADAYSEAKKKLPSFTPCGVFNGTRKAGNIKTYSGFVILDIDKLPAEDVQQVKQKIIASPFTFSCFVSPSGVGLKILCKVSSGAEDHVNAFNQLKARYETETGIEVDKSGKEPSRLCFFSCDSQIYINQNSTVFNVALVQSTPPLPDNKSKVRSPFQMSTFEKCVQLTENKIQFMEGSRNNFINLLANNCNRNGIDKEEALQLILQHYNYDAKEIKLTINSAYKNVGDFATFASFAKFANVAKLANNPQTEMPENEIPVDVLKSTPTVPAHLYHKMPDLIKKGALVFDDDRERDVFLTGALAILSGCLPGVKGVYDRQEVYPNLFSFTIAPAASGKGVLKFAKMLADVYHHSVLKSSRDAEKDYNTQLAEHKQQVSGRKKGDAVIEPPAKPVFKVVYIPANTSYAKILSHIDQNGGNGIICETEADTIGNVFKQEWGSYSDMLRKSFHHEKLSSSRMQNSEFTEVNEPCLSIALSGTPSQVAGLITSAEDGLFSRFLFYAFKVKQRWKDVSPDAGNLNLTSHFKALSHEVFLVVNFLQREQTEIRLTRQQWNTLNKQCDSWLNDITMFTGEEAASIVKRLGLILYRIAMLFTALRKFENSEISTHTTCSDDDFNTALQLAEVYQQHSILMFNNLPRQTENNQFKGGDNKRNFINALPAEFTRKEAVVIGKNFELSESTVSHFLPRLIDIHFSQPKPGHYKKI